MKRQSCILGLLTFLCNVPYILSVQCYVCATLGIKNVRYTSRDVNGAWRTLPQSGNLTGAIDPIFGLPGNVFDFNFGGDPDCASSPFNKSRYSQHGISLCSLQYKWCAKAVDKTGNIARFCMAERQETNVGCAPSGNVSLCICDTELCNDSSPFHYNSVLSTLLSVILVSQFLCPVR